MAELEEFGSTHKVQERYPGVDFFSGTVEKIQVADHGGKLVVGFLCLDEDAQGQDPRDNDGFGDLILFRSHRYDDSFPFRSNSASNGDHAFRDLDALLEYLTETRELWFWVQGYEDLSARVPDLPFTLDGWDQLSYRPSGVFFPCPEVQERFNKAKYRRGGRAKAYRAEETDADGCLDEFSKWANGDVWGVCVRTYEMVEQASGLQYVEVSDDSCWGYIGGDYAEQELSQELAWATKEEATDAA